MARAWLAAMAPRNLLRRRGRSAVTLLVVALAVGALLAAQATDRSVALAIQGIFGTYRADGYLRMGQPLLASQAGTLRRVPGISRAEPKPSYGSRATVSLTKSASSV